LGGEVVGRRHAHLDDGHVEAVGLLASTLPIRLGLGMKP